ncbi:MAG: chemotaxis protein CheA [Bdellovibrio sp.]
MSADFDQEILAGFCDEAKDLLLRWESLCLEMKKEVSGEQVQELFRIAHNLKGGARAVGLMVIGDFIHQIEDEITKLRDGHALVSGSVIQSLLEVQGVLLNWFREVAVDAAYTPSGTDEITRRCQAAMKTTLDQREITANDEVAVILESHVQPGSSSKVPQTAVGGKTPTPAADKKKTSSAETIRISAQKLDEMIQAIGELSIHQSIIWHTRGREQDANRLFSNSLQLSQKLTKELYDRTLSLRMQPLQSVFQRLERNILTLSDELGKPVDVELFGSEVELDKTVIERIIDPLTHIVRNSVDHGIEIPAQRASSGKPAKGKIAIIARQDTFGVEIIVQDDGKGLSSERILEKAIERGLVVAGSKPPREEILNYVFLPGFSTAEKVTEVSGRGVGMDVVRRTLEELQGTIHLESEEGQGTKLSITLPTSVSIIDALLIKLSGQNYVLPMGSISEVVNLPKDFLIPTGNMMSFQDRALPIQDLESLLRPKVNIKFQVGQRRTLIIAQTQGRHLGLLVDGIHGQQQIVIRPLNENISGAYGILGGTILGNGEPGLIVDIGQLANDFIRRTNAREASA